MVAGFKSNIQALCTRELLDDHEEAKEKTIIFSYFLSQSTTLSECPVGSIRVTTKSIED